MRFTPQLLDEIRARLPVSHVVARKVALKKAGREFRGLSPFKSEKSPSFFVNDQKGFYHCFASGEHGDIFKFVMQTEGLTFPEAVERLAQEAGVVMPKEGLRDQVHEDERTRIYQLLAASAAFFEASLKAPIGEAARRYIEKRGLARETVSTFGIGYAPSGRHALKEHLAKAGFTTAEMVASGMLIGGDDIAVPYDRFRNRVMFPICDLRGKPIAFGGRALDADAPAKYLNSPETPLFHKGHVLFNAHRARQAAHDLGQVIAVEGYMDVVALAEGGFAHAVAPLGTALTEDQVKLLWRMAQEPILCFDGDSAGKKAAYRAVDTVLPHLKPGASVAFAFLPDGLDPDDLIRQSGADAMTDVLAHTRPLAEVLWEREWVSGDWSTPERRARLEQQVFALVARIADPTVRGHYEREMRERLAGAWGSAPPQVRGGWDGDRGERSWNGHSGRRGDRQPSANRSAFNGPRQGGAGRGRGPMPPMPIAASISSNLRQSALAAGGPATVPFREALLLQAVLNHPWLIDEHAERLAVLELTTGPLERLRAAILEIHAADNPLDTDQLRTQLSRSGLDKVVDLVERAITHRSDKFAEPEAEAATVEQGWLHAMALHDRQVGLRRALEAAGQAWHQDDADAFARIREIRHQLDAAEVPEGGAHG